MKKVVLILLALFYLVVTSGVSLSAHYCGGKIKSLSFFSTHSEKDCCGSSKMKKKDCCKEKATLIKVKDNHQSNRILKTPVNSLKLLSVIISSLSFYFTPTSKTIAEHSYYGKPVLYDKPLYLQHRVLLI